MLISIDANCIFTTCCPLRWYQNGRYQSAMPR